MKIRMYPAAVEGPFVVAPDGPRSPKEELRLTAKVQEFLNIRFANAEPMSRDEWKSSVRGALLKVADGAEDAGFLVSREAVLDAGFEILEV